MKNVFSILTIGICALLFFCTACTDENEKTDTATRPVPLVVRATASGFDFPEDATAPHPYDSGNGGASVTRTPTEEGLNTVFSTGDRIGLFAIKDNAIIDGIDNLCLTYDADTGEWNPPAGKGLYYYDGVTYLAYYPYNSAITANGASAKTENDIKTYLTAHANLQPKADQSTPESYTASDLMTAAATSADVITDATSGKRSFDLKFTHRFSLLVLVPQMSDYVAPAGHTYTYWPGAVSATLNDITPYRMADGSYRAIVPPTTTASTLHGSYEDATGKTVAYQSESYSGGFAVGGCYKVLVAKSVSGTPERAVAVGDFYMQNGMIVAGTQETLTEKQKADCIGVVFYSGQPAGDNANYSSTGIGRNICHGYVVSLKYAGSYSWGPNNERVGTQIANSGWQGYSDQQIMEQYAANKGRDFSTYPAAYYSKNYTPVAPANSSGWFLPATGQVTTFYGNRATLNTQIQKAGGSSIESTSHSTSSELASAQTHIIGINSGNGVYTASKLDKLRVRPVLAF